MDTPTAQEVIEDVAVELGLSEEAQLSDPFGSEDENIIRLCRLLKRVGRLLVRARDWTHLTREYTFPTVALTASYALPTDFARLKDGTEWNRDTIQPLGPAVGAQTWQSLQANTSAGLLNPPFRVFGNKLHIYPTPSAAEDICFEYITKYWVVPTGQTVPTASAPDDATDVLWFDEPLLTAGLKLAFLRSKGMDTQAAQQDFKTAWDAAVGGDGAAPELPLSPGKARLLDTRNLPDAGWGT